MLFVRLGTLRGSRSAVLWAARKRILLARACLAASALLLAGCSRMPMLNPVGTVGEDETRLFYLAVGVMLSIIVPVILLTLWFAWRYRASSGKRGYDPEFTESPIISKVTLFVPLLTISVLGALTWIYTHRLDPYRPLPGHQSPYEIQAISLDYKWLFIYPEEGVATINELVAPTGRPVTLRMTSDPMMTSIFIPGLISQIYTMPGMETRANFMVHAPTERQGANGMYSGPGFEYQRFKTRLVSPDDFHSWVASVKQGNGNSEKHDALLDWAKFNALLPQSTVNPVTYFASVEPDLFARAVRKYMPHYQMNPLPDRAEFDNGMLSAPMPGQAAAAEMSHQGHADPQVQAGPPTPAATHPSPADATPTAQEH